MTYNYTKPRVPIAAMYASPGPCYALPTLVGFDDHDPRSIHRRWPAYQFGVLGLTKFESIGPGPAFVLGQMYKNGKYTPPAWSISQIYPPNRGFVTPAPGTYRPEDCMKVAYSTAPWWSMRARLEAVKSDHIPAPNQYIPDPMLGTTVRSNKPTAPQYSLTAKNDMFNFLFDWAKSPGPGAHDAVPLPRYLKAPPLYSILRKVYPPGDATLKPGPGAHQNEKVWTHKRSAPMYSFGIQHSPYSPPLLTPVDLGVGLDFDVC